MIKAHECDSNFGFQEVKVRSHSDPKTFYNVLFTPWDRDDPDQASCECISYRFRGWCTHQIEAYQEICRWSSLDGVEQKEPGVCPMCGGPTRAVYYEEENEDQ